MVVVFLPFGQTQDDLTDPDTQYTSLDDFDSYRESFCDEEFSSAKAYITAEFDGGNFPDSGLFIVGGDDGVNSPNDQPDLYTNGFLCFSGSYTFFVRAYPLLDISVRNWTYSFL